MHSVGSSEVDAGLITEVPLELAVAMRLQLSQLGVDFSIVSSSGEAAATRGSAGVLVPGVITSRIRFSAVGVANQELAVSAGARVLLIPIRGAGVP